MKQFFKNIFASKKLTAIFFSAAIAVVALAVILPFILYPVVNQDKRDKYINYSIQSVQIVQKGAQSHDITVSCEGEVAEMYFTRYERLRDTDMPVDYALSGSGYKFNVPFGEGEYYLHTKTSRGYSVQPIAIPYMHPYIDKLSDTVYKLYYEFTGGTSWSSFCDAEGKNLYKSSKNFFDSTATLVSSSDGVNITVDSSNDSNSSSSTHYFVVLNSKNGLVTYISHSVWHYDLVAKLSTATITTESGNAFLNLTGTLQDGFSPDFVLKIRSGNEVYKAEDTNLSANVFTFKFNLSALTAPSSWYDVVLEDKITGLEMNVERFVGSNTGLPLISGKRIYSFKGWHNQLKINFEQISQSYTLENVSLQTIDSKQYLKVNGTLASSADNKIMLTVRYLPEGFEGEAFKETVDEVINTKTNGTFEMLFDLSKMSAANNWHDIQLYVPSESKSYDIIYDSNYMNLSQTISGKDKNNINRIFEFKEYELQLKLNIRP